MLRNRNFVEEIEIKTLRTITGFLQLLSIPLPIVYGK